jgi:hypothetical protein
MLGAARVKPFQYTHINFAIMLSRLYNGPGVCAGTAPRADHLPGLAVPLRPLDRAALPLDAGSARWYNMAPGISRSWRCALSFPTKPTWIGATL